MIWLMLLVVLYILSYDLVELTQSGFTVRVSILFLQSFFICYKPLYLLSV